MSDAQPEWRISIVIPTYRREGLLVDGIRYLLALSVPADELLVIDQTPSHDAETEAFLSESDGAGRIRWIRHAPPGVVGAMNRGLIEARGDIVLFLDDDIIPLPDLVTAHRRTHKQFPEAWAVAGRVLQPEDDGSPSEMFNAGDRGESLKHGVWTGEEVGRESGVGSRESPLRRDLDFPFNSGAPAWVQNVMAGNLSVRRDRALAIGGFDENFIPPVSYRFETEFAKRLVAAGGRIRFEPSAAIRHLRAADGGTRSLGSHLKSASPLHGVGDYYYAFKQGQGLERLRYVVRRPFREVCTRFHLLHPWWIPVKLWGEFRALCLAWQQCRQGPSPETHQGSR